MKLLKIRLLVHFTILFGFVNQCLCCNKAIDVEKNEKVQEVALEKDGSDEATSTTTQKTLTREEVAEYEQLMKGPASHKYGLDKATSTTRQKRLTKEEVENFTKLLLAQLEYDVINGVAINISLPRNSPSSSGCPEPLMTLPLVERLTHWQYDLKDKTPWVYYKEAGGVEKCYLASFQGPCEKDMILYANKSSQYGYCNCKCNDERAYRTNRACCKTQLKGVGGKPAAYYKSWIFVKQWDSCRLLHEQGHCGTGNRRILGGSTLDNHCKRQRCSSGEEFDFMFYDHATGECYDFSDEQCRRHVKKAQRYYTLDVTIYYHKTFYDKIFALCLCSRVVDFPDSRLGIGPNSCRKDEKFSNVFGKCVKLLSRN